MKGIPRLQRHHEIRRVRANLERESFPRLQMLLLVTLTGASGFIASYIFLSVGLEEMWLRYLASICVAYGMFLVFLWLWLRTSAYDYVDATPDISGAPSSDFGGSSASYSGEGGDFGGGGASGSFDGSPEDISVFGDSSGSVGDALDSAGAADELAIPLFALVLVAAVVFSSLFLVYSAPVLFAELLVDGVLSASLYSRLRGLETRHWLETAVRRTAWPFALTAVVVAALGWGMALYAPEAHSIGEVVAHAKLA